MIHRHGRRGSPCLRNSRWYRRSKGCHSACGCWNHHHHKRHDTGREHSVVVTHVEHKHTHAKKKDARFSFENDLFRNKLVDYNLLFVLINSIVHDNESTRLWLRYKFSSLWWGYWIVVVMHGSWISSSLFGWSVFFCWLWGWHIIRQQSSLSLPLSGRQFFSWSAWFQIAVPPDTP